MPAINLIGEMKFLALLFLFKDIKMEFNIITTTKVGTFRRFQSLIRKIMRHNPNSKFVLFDGKRTVGIDRVINQ